MRPNYLEVHKYLKQRPQARLILLVLGQMGVRLLLLALMNELLQLIHHHHLMNNMPMREMI
jgi:hypothetical protein